MAYITDVDRDFHIDRAQAHGTHGFQDWAVKHTNANTRVSGQQAPLRMTRDPRVVDRHHAFIFGKYGELGDKWPGFYAGHETWIIPNERMETQEEVTWDNCHEVLERLLLAHGINIYADVQIINVPEEDFTNTYGAYGR